MRLATLQGWFFGQLQPGARRSAGPVVGTRGLSGLKRLAIYGDMYAARLVDALGQEYPRLAGALGATRFARLATQYLARFPSRKPTIQDVGERLPRFLRAELKAGRLSRFAYAADLAGLERIGSQVYVAADAVEPDDTADEPIDAAFLRSVRAEAWPELRFRVNPTLRVIRLGFEFPKAGKPMRRKVAYRVYRRGLEVYEAPMDVAETRALSLVSGGQSFGQVCLALGDARKAAVALATWVEEGLLFHRR